MYENHNYSYKHGISLCTIMKNEEANLPEFLKLHDKFCDEIVLVDTGSEDKSMEIAKDFGAVVLEFPMNDDFSAPRNFGLSNCRYSWIIQLDLDERIAEKDNYKIRSAIRNQRFVAFMMTKRSYMNDSTIGGFEYDDGSYPEFSKGFKGWSREPNHLLFINHPKVKYEGCIHETVGRSLFSLGDISKLDVPIHHYGRHDMSEKEERYCRLAIHRAEELNDSDAWFTVGSHYDWMQKSDKAAEAFLKCLELNPRHHRVYFGLGLSYVKMMEYDKAIEAFENHIKESPKSEILAWSHLVRLYGSHVGDIVKAEKTLEKALSFYDKNLLAYYAMGVVYFEKEQYAKSMNCLDNILKIDPENTESLILKKRILKILAPYLKQAKKTNERIEPLKR